MKKLLCRLTALVLSLCVLAVPVSALSVEQAVSLLDEYYIDDLPEAAVQAQTLDELIAALGDPYTVYMTAEEYEAFTNSIHDARLVGIGVSIEVHEAGMLISSVLDDSPALDAGLVSGDIILSANGTPLTSLEQAQTLLAGEIGTTVTIEVLRADGTTLQLELTRREIVVPTTVQHALSQDGNALVISCTSFGDETPRHIAAAVKEYTDQVNSFILDLSVNPGGTSQSGAGAAGCFIGSGVMLYLRNGQDQYNYTMVLPGHSPLTDKSVIVLTSPYSASSSELFLGAIRDYGAGISIGQRTKGKGVAQVALDETTYPDLFQGDALKVTAYRFFSPHGTTNDRIGVMPTLLLSLENTYNAALLLSADAPEQSGSHLKLTLSGHVFYIQLDTALSGEFRPAFVELLEALPPYAQLRWNMDGSRYSDTTPQAVAQRLGLSEYSQRTFSDIGQSAYANSINTLAVYGLLSGYGDGTFRPDSTLTRAEFCAMLVNLLGGQLEPISQSAFYDVGIGDWYAPAVHEIHKMGLLTGYGDGSFLPNNAISQQEVVSILARLSTQLNMYAYNRRNLTPEPEVMAEFSHFSDWAQQSAWLLDSCEVELSSLTTPQDNATRAQAAQLMCQLLAGTGVLWPGNE